MSPQHRPVGAILLFVAVMLALLAMPWEEGEQLLILPLVAACAFAGAGLAVLWSRDDNR